MASTARSDAENAYRACLGVTDCAAFSACVAGVQGGSTGPGPSNTGGSGGGGGGGGSSAGGSGGASDAGSGNGGSGTGDAGMGGSPAPTEVVTSAQNAYWVTGQVTRLTSGTADLNVDKNTTYQRWDGFGGTF